jgi:hypothetical protein
MLLLLPVATHSRRSLHQAGHKIKKKPGTATEGPFRKDANHGNRRKVEANLTPAIRMHQQRCE